MVMRTIADGQAVIATMDAVGHQQERELCQGALRRADNKKSILR